MLLIKLCHHNVESIPSQNAFNKQPIEYESLGIVYYGALMASLCELTLEWKLWFSVDA